MPADTSSNQAKGATSPFSLKKTLVELLIVSLIAAGAGALLSSLNPPATPVVEKPPLLGKEAGCAAAPNILDLPPVVANLAAPVDAWIRVEASIVFDPKTMPHPEVVAAEIATDELAYLRTLALTEIQGPIGLANLRQDLTDRAATRSGGKVTEFILRTVVVQ